MGSPLYIQSTIEPKCYVERDCSDKRYNTTKRCNCKYILKESQSKYINQKLTELKGERDFYNNR